MKNTMLKIAVASMFVAFASFGVANASENGKPTMKCQAGKCGGASKCGNGKAEPADTNATKGKGKCGGASKCGGQK